MFQKKNKFLSIIFILAFLQSCSVFSKKNEESEAVKTVLGEKKRLEPNLRTRAEKYEGTLLLGGKKKDSNTFDFATSNVLWRASIEALDFIPLANASYSGGVIVTDWYSPSLSSNEQVKIEVNFLSSDLKPSSINVKSFKKTCENSTLKCKTVSGDKNFNEKIKSSIFNKARELNIEKETKK
jgi:hypothetical protein